MKECKDCTFPDVKKGDVVRFIEDGDLYLVCRDQKDGTKKILCSLDGGNIWDSNSLWGLCREPNEFEKVEVCYKVL